MQGAVNPCLAFFYNITINFITKKQGGIFMQDYLRKQVKLLKATQGINYKELAEYLEVKPISLYSWLNGYYDLSSKKEHRLIDIINTLKE